MATDVSDEPIYMLNALWFEGEAGAALYGEYAAAAAPFVEKYGGRLVASYAPDLALIGDWDPDLFAGKRRLYYGRWTYKFESAARQGAAGALLIHTTESARYPWKTVQTSWGGESSRLPSSRTPRMPWRSALWTILSLGRRSVKGICVE